MPTQKERILLVEDNDTMRDGVRDVLDLAGYDVEVATDGERALALLDEVRPDLIISDIMMPQMDGYHFYEAVRRNRRWHAIPFIFLTAKGERADVRLGKQLGADDYLTKPFDAEDLLITVESKLKRSQQLEDLSQAAIAELKSSIVRTLSHEFRTPLTFIQGYSELLEMSGPDIDSQSFQEFLRGIRRGSERLNRLVEDFLLLVRLQTGQTDEALQASNTDVRVLSLLRRVADLHDESATEAGIEIDVSADPNLVVRTNEVYLFDIVSRLLDNAIKFSRGRMDRVWMQAQDGAQVVIEVIDRGIGIPSRDIPHLFNVLEQINRVQYEQQGAGLGLAISQGLAHLLEGEIQVQATEGKGSTFRVVLPRRSVDEV